MTFTVSRRTRRRFILGCQGLWPGRRATGLAGTGRTLRLVEAVQVDPIAVVARSHDLVLHSRVSDYRPEHLDTLLYKKREFFDYGGCVRLMPMAELPYVRWSMEQVRHSDRWRSYEDVQGSLLAQVRGRLRDDGPLAARDFAGVSGRRGTFRSSKDTSVALYYLWLSGEVMTYARRNFDRVYALRSEVAPAAHDYVATKADADAYSARKAARWAGLFTGGSWASRFHRWVVREERAALLADLVDAGYLTEVAVEGERELHYVPTDRLTWLEQVDAGRVPAAWRRSGPETSQEAVLLSPFDVARGQSSLFDVSFVFEAYKPAAKRRWGYYTMPVLYGDEIVARVDPALDRGSGTLRIKGLWLEDEATARDELFVDALGASVVRLARFVGADRIDVDAVDPRRMRLQLQAITNSDH